MLRLLVVALALAGTLLGGLGGAAPASAHAALTGSTPAQGSVADRAPGQVTLTFSEGVAMSDDSIRVLNPQGERVDEKKLRNLSSGRVVKYGAGLPSGLRDGTYTVAWQAVSADSHPVSGAFTFSIGAPSKTTAPVPRQEAGGGVVGALYGIARYLAYAGFVLLAGGAAFVMACRPAAALVRSVQRLVVYGWALLAGTTVAMLLLRTPYTGSGDLADVLDLGGLQQVLLTKPGTALIARLLLLAAAALFVAMLFGAYARAYEPAEADGEGTGDGTGEEPVVDAAEQAGRRRTLTLGLGFGGAIVATGLAATWAMAEHASAGLQPAVAMPVDVLHLLAVAVWLGGLAALLVSLYWGPPVERTAVRRFSRLAFGSVVVLVATGLYQSWRQVGTWQALVDTTYGQLLLVKVALVVVLVGIAWLSRQWTGRLAEVPAAELRGAEDADGAEEAVETGRVSVGASAGAVAGGAGPKGGAAPKGGAPLKDGAAPQGGTASEPGSSPEPGASAASGTGATGDGTGDADRDAAAPGPDPAPDPARAAQLARQQDALRTARTKRVRDADQERLGLRRSVLAEASVAVVLLVVTTALTATEPARTEAAAKATSGGRSAPAPGRPQALVLPFDTGGPRGKGTARVDLAPGRSGRANTVQLRITDLAGKPLDVPEVKVSFTEKSKKLGPLSATLRHSGEGRWQASGVQLPVPGQWRLSLVVRTSDIDQVTEFRNVKIGS
ncbi:FixH family protein [Streptomyces sp. NPDC048611]|uniref:copper resistance CopC/CopD family protein n=1 Tax=Streptomyces sp. NPDC048611 TaxID=3155635 RepID=UPI003427C476